MLYLRFEFFVILFLFIMCCLLVAVFWEVLTIKCAGCYYFILSAWTDNWSSTIKYSPLPSEDEASIHKLLYIY